MNLHEKHILGKQYLFFCGITLWTVKWVLDFQQWSKSLMLCHKYLNSIKFLLERRLFKETNYWFSPNNSMSISNLLGLVLNYCQLLATLSLLPKYVKNTCYLADILQRQKYQLLYFISLSKIRIRQQGNGKFTLRKLFLYDKRASENAILSFLVFSFFQFILINIF